MYKFAKFLGIMVTVVVTWGFVGGILITASVMVRETMVSVPFITATWALLGICVYLSKNTDKDSNKKK